MRSLSVVLMALGIVVVSACRGAAEKAAIGAAAKVAAKVWNDSDRDEQRTNTKDISFQGRGDCDDRKIRDRQHEIDEELKQARTSSDESSARNHLARAQSAQQDLDFYLSHCKR